MRPNHHPYLCPHNKKKTFSYNFQFSELLSQNTTSGAFRKLGRLYESCLRQELNSSSIRLTMEKLGGYMPINALGPSNVMPLLLKMKQFGGPLLLLDIYYDLSYGRRPQVLLIIDIPPDVHYILQVCKIYDNFMPIIFSKMFYFHFFLFVEHCSFSYTKSSIDKSK